MASKKSKPKKTKEPKQPKKPLRKKKHAARPHAMVIPVDKRGRVSTGEYGTGSTKKGLRGFIGGGVERGESLRKAMQRESREEALIRVRFIGKPVEFRCQQTRVKVTAQLARIVAGRPRNTREMKRFWWQRPNATLAERKLAQRSRLGLALLYPQLQQLQN